MNLDEKILGISEQVTRFKGCIYISDQHAMFTPDQGVLKIKQFNVLYGGANFALTHDRKLTTKKAFNAFVYSHGYKFPKVSTSCFRPDIESGKIINIQGVSKVNTYIPVKINEMKKMDIELIKKTSRIAAKWWADRFYCRDAHIFAKILDLKIKDELIACQICKLENDYEPKGILLDVIIKMRLKSYSFFPEKHTLRIEIGKLSPKEGYGNWTDIIIIK